MDDFKSRIKEGCERVFENMKRRLPMCIEAQGYHFQHLLLILLIVLYLFTVITLLVYTYCADLFVFVGLGT
jgi:hypothetical protein